MTPEPTEPDPLKRLDADAELFNELGAAWFAGPAWDLFAQEMSRYAVGVLLAWMSTGHIFAMVRANKIPLKPSAEEVHRFATDADFRDEIADAAVVEALHTFRERSRKEDGWRREGGASLSTYFVGGCVHAFVNELKKYRRAEERNRKSQIAAAWEEAARPAQDRASEDPAQRMADLEVLREHMEKLAERDRNIVWGKAFRRTNKEIAEIFGEKSARSVEQRWSWLMAHEEWIARLGKES